mmetsp:Transcript_24611/g.27380  ORF Transcript_24611/g.27380 Transcript_24611/m.27380 type:complete len:256 (-) Transcript_24611:785-1552(-)
MAANINELSDLFADTLRHGTKEEMPPLHRPFKPQTGASDQETRRHDTLDRQRSARENRLAKLRDITSAKPKTPKKKKPTYIKQYKELLMMPEAMTGLPQDLLENWYIKAYPVGTRCLVVAERHKTRAYRRNGKCLLSFNSPLPGGGIKPRGRETLLDCIFVESEMRFYIVDILTWNGNHVIDCELEMREYWIKTKIEEDIEEEWGTYDFSLLPSLPCSVKTQDLVEHVNNQSQTFAMHGTHLSTDPAKHYTVVFY